MKAIDEQEGLHSDMAISAFLLALLRSNMELEEDDGVLRNLLEEAMRHGVENLGPELEKLYQITYQNSTDLEKCYLPLIEKRIDHGSVAELMRRRFQETREIKPLLAEMEASLRNNIPFMIE